MSVHLGMFSQAGEVMRIVDTDNFGGDEKFILWPMSRDKAQRIADILNEDCGDYTPRYYKVVENDYKLKPGFEP